MESGHDGHGCALCWPADAAAAWAARDRLGEDATVVEEPHFIVRILACAPCGQRFVSVTTEQIDWDDGEDPVQRILIPVTPAEAGAVAAGRGSAASIAAIVQSRRSLVQDWPKGEPAKIFWARGIWIGPYD
jgi:hypothetical protein